MLLTDLGEGGREGGREGGLANMQVRILADEDQGWEGGREGGREGRTLS